MKTTEVKNVVLKEKLREEVAQEILAAYEEEGKSEEKKESVPPLKEGETKVDTTPPEEKK
jgi:hypothetical protein